MVLLPVFGGNLPIYSTDPGNLAGGSADPNWSVAGPNIGEPPSPATVLSGGALYYTWDVDTAASGWIGVYNLQGQPPAPYTFSETFSLAGFQVSSAQISGNWYADDYMQLFVNGIALSPAYDGGSNPHWGYPIPFSVPNADLNAGLNTITAVMQQSDQNYDGVRVEIDTATADALGVPDAASTALLLGFASATLAAGRRITRRA
jgi:hypothetical protein